MHSEAPAEGQPQRRNGRVIDVAVILAVVGAGWWFWGCFFGFGRVGLSLDDRPMHGYSLDIYRLALRHGQVPWTVNWGSVGTPRFLANPETPLSPLILHLPWISNTMFAMLESQK